MSYRRRLFKFARTAYPWWLDRAFYVAVEASAPITCWILETGFWVDSCNWDDGETWID